MFNKKYPGNTTEMKKPVQLAKGRKDQLQQ